MVLYKTNYEIFAWCKTFYNKGFVIRLTLGKIFEVDFFENLLKNFGWDFTK